MKKKVRKADWHDFYLIITEMMPEFKFDQFDEHINGEYEARCRFLNKYKLKQLKKFAKEYNKTKKVGAGMLFLLKLELAKTAYGYDNRGKKTMAEALAFIKG